ncbi:MAG: hypothetical protein LBI17_03610, partial [Rickettsiales bacterium]|nr:hypothetical protein [Rickettsiales bacterium]
PDQGLCFDPEYANFVIDMQCSKTIAKSKTPSATKRLFLDYMGLLREQSCQRMNGEISADRSQCLILVEYGISKDNLSAHKKVAVGDIFTCSASAFDTKLGENFFYRRQKFIAAARTVTSGIRIAGSVVGMAAGPLGGALAGVIDGAVDMGVNAADIAITADQVRRGEISEEQADAYYKKAGLGLTMSAASVAVNAVTFGTARGFTSGAKTVGNVTVQVVSEAAQTAGKVLTTVGTILTVGSQVAELGVQIADQVMEDDLAKQQRDEEARDIIKVTEFQDRDAGVGVINTSSGMRGACFVNHDWFATENEVIMMQWTL